MAKYENLSRQDLVSRLQSFERQSTVQVEDEAMSTPRPASPDVKKPVKPARQFNFASHPTRHIALLLSYHGWPYSGLAIQSALSPTALPTVEGELLVALEKAKLVEEGKGWEGCNFSRCGRTDRGVSGEGQVVDLWVRSNRKEGDGGCDLENVGWRPAAEPKQDTKPEPEEGKSSSKPGVKARAPAEFAFPHLLNSLLPPSIRILAWSPLPAISPPPISTSSTRLSLPAPAPEPFDARFSCTSRHYKYAFHLRPTPSSPPLDLELMRTAAKLLIGEHDFRNFCKLDGSKQIENHSRGVVDAWIDVLPGSLAEDGKNTLCVFNLVGTAFLWHQVRHIVAILFLVGSKLEPTSIIPTLLNTGVHPPLPLAQNPEKTVPTKPVYNMASPIPLTLHSCGYEERAGLDWRYGPYDGPWGLLSTDDRKLHQAQAMSGIEALQRTLESQRQDAEIRAWQVGAAARKLDAIFPESSAQSAPTGQGAIYPVGGGDLIIVKKYQDMMQRKRGDTPEVVNQRWREGQGARRALRKGAGGELEE